jgi:hypothetical protein
LLQLEKYGEQEQSSRNYAYKDMMLGETQEAGTYTLYAIPEKDSYTIIISKDLNVWDPTTTKKLMMLPD